MAKAVQDKLDALVARVGKVRRWLVALAILKLAALCLTFVSLYIGAYAWLDHRLNFGEMARIPAFLLLIAGITFLAHRLMKRRIAHVSCSTAANYIENKHSFDQQLVTAIEYYENKQNYPYSSALAEQLVLQVERDSADFRFDATVQKWQGYVMGAVVLFGLVVAWFYVKDNYVYFASYFARLTRPLASVEVLSPTHLESITKNLAAEPAPEIESMTAQVTLPRQPSRRKWVKPYTEQIENNTLEVLPGSNVTLNVKATDKLEEVVATSLDGKPMAKSLDGTEEFSFHFTADKSGSVHFDLTNQHGLTSKGLPGLEVVVKTDEPPKLELISPEGDYLATDVSSVPVTFKVTDDFGLESIEMHLEIPGQEPTSLSIPIEEGDRSKTFTHTIELEEHNLSVGDSILYYAKATDVDTGSTPANRTSSSEVYFIEIRPYRQNWRPKSGGGPSPSGMPAPVELLNILEYTRAIVKKTWAIADKPSPTDQDRSALESIDNDVQYCAEQLAMIRDDSDYGFKESHKAVLNMVLQYYKQASGYLARYDAPSALKPEKEAYRILRKFILESELELNPPQSGQSPPEEKPDSVKLQEKPPEYSEMEAERVEGELKQMQQKLDKLTKEQEVLKRTFKNLLEQQADNEQLVQKATSQEPSKTTSGEQGQDKATENQQGKTSPGQQGEQLSENRQDSQNAAGGKSRSKGQTSSEIKNESGSPGTESKQDSVKTQNASSKSQDTEDGKSISGSSSTDDNQSSADKQRGEKKQSQGEGRNAAGSPGSEDKQSHAEAQGRSEGQNPGDNNNASSGQNPGQGKDATEGQGERQANGGTQPNSANADLRLRMLQAKQKALQEQVSQLKRDLQQLPETSRGNSNEGRAQAQEHLDQALEKMDDFQAKLTESRYQADMDARQSSEALETAEAAKRQMDFAQKAIESELSWTDDQRTANEAKQMAEQLAEDADAFDESVTEAEREDMLARLETAKQLLERMPEPQWAQIGPSQRTQSSNMPVLTKNPNLAPAEAARQMARQFWSIALNAKKRRQPLVKEKSSDVKFYGQENEFFENAAKYESEPVQK